MSRWYGGLAGLVLLGGVGSAVDPPATAEVPTVIKGGATIRLGVVAQTTANGARILSVTRGSPAAKAGLEPGDQVLSVDGFTVGVIKGVPFHLWSEVRRVRGVGVFKVRDKRTGEVVTMRINLGAGSGPGDDEDGGDEDGDGGYRRKP
ncbi:MAG: PDZ domain-containing protein [Gemmataceae bacterium]|nr:PDZ domain-containing protein [Gemmataceae bacterium]